MCGEVSWLGEASERGKVNCSKRRGPPFTGRCPQVQITSSKADGDTRHYDGVLPGPGGLMQTHITTPTLRPSCSNAVFPTNEVVLKRRLCMARSGLNPGSLTTQDQRYSASALPQLHLHLTHPTPGEDRTCTSSFRPNDCTRYMELVLCTTTHLSRGCPRGSAPYPRGPSPQSSLG